MKAAEKRSTSRPCALLAASFSLRQRRKCLTSIDDGCVLIFNENVYTGWLSVLPVPVCMRAHESPSVRPIQSDKVSHFHLFHSPLSSLVRAFAFSLSLHFCLSLLTSESCAVSTGSRRTVVPCAFICRGWTRNSNKMRWLCTL